MQRPSLGKGLAQAPHRSQGWNSDSEFTVSLSLLHPSGCPLLPSLNSSSHAWTTVVQPYFTGPCPRAPCTFWPPGPPSHYCFLAGDTAGSRKDKQTGTAGKWVGRGGEGAAICGGVDGGWEQPLGDSVGVLIRALFNSLPPWHN